MSSVVFKFTNGKEFVSYTASNPGDLLVATFDDGSRNFKDPETGNIWLQIQAFEKAYHDGESAIILFDYKSQALIALHQKRGTKYNLYNLIVS